ncbi:hypothetical protein POSPLADRAFT_1047691 [Postia placenta MAD-698-R-SB12]|uniref:Uncharacterized protein n=1 Tax=Postia placenta MAD-698-R-SB12 TaxID=670580 RepID=A0A1X6MV15_9APHY|nr:hypothetical protein POSPLADRAFT_1047691 [Postia placenta MAD-698-R-SB12]OSX60224.1 hypothetical protein POSPLADRAFT_1047691 [Postia placenta MAD-698-R-SB12]
MARYPGLRGVKEPVSTAVRQPVKLSSYRDGTSIKVGKRDTFVLSAAPVKVGISIPCRCSKFGRGLMNVDLSPESTIRHLADDNQEPSRDTAPKSSSSADSISALADELAECTIHEYASNNGPMLDGTDVDDLCEGISSLTVSTDFDDLCDAFSMLAVVSELHKEMDELTDLFAKLTLSNEDINTEMTLYNLDDYTDYSIDSGMTIPVKVLGKADSPPTLPRACVSLPSDLHALPYTSSSLSTCSLPSISPSSSISRMPATPWVPTATFMDQFPAHIRLNPSAALGCGFVVVSVGLRQPTLTPPAAIFTTYRTDSQTTLDVD